MQNFTGSWARAASNPMPTQPQQAGLASPTAMASSLRPQPKPAAGLNEKPQMTGSQNLMMDVMYRLFGPGKAGGINYQRYKPAAPAAQQQAAPAAPSQSDRLDRASRLMEIGAGLMS